MKEGGSKVGASHGETEPQTGDEEKPLIFSFKPSAEYCAGIQCRDIWSEYRVGISCRNIIM